MQSGASFWINFKVHYCKCFIFLSSLEIFLIFMGPYMQFSALFRTNFKVNDFTLLTFLSPFEKFVIFEGP